MACGAGVDLVGALRRSAAGGTMSVACHVLRATANVPVPWDDTAGDTAGHPGLGGDDDVSRPAPGGAAQAVPQSPAASLPHATPAPMVCHSVGELGGADVVTSERAFWAAVGRMGLEETTLVAWAAKVHPLFGCSSGRGLRRC